MGRSKKAQRQAPAPAQAPAHTKREKRGKMGKFVKDPRLQFSLEELNSFNDDNDNNNNNNNNCNDRVDDDNVSNDDDSLLSSDDCSAAATSLHGSKKKEDTAVEYKNKTEEYAVLGMKWTVYFVLFVAAAALGFVTFILTEKEEMSTFEGEVSTIQVATTNVMH
jgi:hypothetical protein